MTQSRAKKQSRITTVCILPGFLTRNLHSAVSSKNKMSCTFQVEVPVCVYSDCYYLMPAVMHTWAKDRGLTYSMAGWCSYGTGYHDDGKTNKEYMYTISNAKPGDDTAFKVLFPECRVYPVYTEQV